MRKTMSSTEYLQTENKKVHFQIRIKSAGDSGFLQNC